MTDWFSYDSISESYDRLWLPLFAAVARRMAQLVAPCAEDAVLDIGTGTGILAAALEEAVAQSETARRPGMAAAEPPLRLLVACDRSRGMLDRARRRAPQLRAVLADAAALPFASEVFDRITSSFVVSHVADYRAFFREAFRVARPSRGRLAVSNWVPATDPHTTCWNQCLAQAITQPEVDRAMALLPWEEHFSHPGRLESAMEEAGFAPERCETVEFASELTLEQFVSQRELNLVSRLGQSLLGDAGWAAFRASTLETLRARFGPTFTYRRSALIAVGRKQ